MWKKKVFIKNFLKSIQTSNLYEQCRAKKYMAAALFNVI